MTRFADVWSADSGDPARELTGISMRAGTRRYSEFLTEIRDALLADDQKAFGPLLDGRAATRCLDLVPGSSVRRLGAFFTPSDLALRILKQLSVRSWAHAVVFDPSCGAGDLLLPIAARLQLKRTVSLTLRFWNEQILGCDVSPEFVTAARLRLVLVAAKRGAILDGDPDTLAQLLSNLHLADGLAATEAYAKSSHVIMNPPFGRIVPGARPWREGTTTAAALFVERAARLSAPGTQIVALLPEVLRTGTSYAGWRRHIGSLATQGKPESLGVFSEHADIDVFVQRFTRRPAEVACARPPKRRGRQTVGSKFRVSVGSVVPHRDPDSGPRYAYLHTANTTPWSEIRRITETRRFTGRTFSPPFVLIRRTSRPGDGYRAVATLVLGKRRVAVENHLLVVLPRRGRVAICRTLIRLLRSKRTTVLLDRAMRCRHLTTASASSLPWI